MNVFSTGVKTSLDVFEKYLNQDINIESFKGLSFKELVARCQIILQNHPDIDVDAFAADLEKELKDVSSNLDKLIEGLRDVEARPGYEATFERLAGNLEELKDLAQGDNDLFDALLEAKDLHNTLNVNRQPGDAPYEHKPSEAKNGYTFTIDATGMGDKSTTESYWNRDNPNNIDTDGDGVNDAIFDMEGDIEIMDLDGDGDVDKDDQNIALGDPNQPNDVVDLRQLPAGTEISLASFDNSNPSAPIRKLKIKLPEPDNIVYYIDIIGEKVKILSHVMLKNIDSAPPSIANWWFEGTGENDKSAAFHLERLNPSLISEPSRDKTRVDLGQTPDNSYSINITDDMINNQEEVIIEFDASQRDILNIDLSGLQIHADAVVSFGYDSTGNPACYISTEDGKTAKIVLIGMQHSLDPSLSDQVKIHGGGTLASNHTSIDSYVVPGVNPGDGDEQGLITSMIYFDDQPINEIPNEIDITDSTYRLGIDYHDMIAGNIYYINFDPNTVNELTIIHPDGITRNYESSLDGSHQTITIETADGICTIYLMGQDSIGGDSTIFQERRR